MSRELRIWIAAFAIGLPVMIYLVFFAKWGSTVDELNAEPSDFITMTYESPITEDCFEIVRRYNRSEIAMSVQIDCELIND